MISSRCSLYAPDGPKFCTVESCCQFEDESITETFSGLFRTLNNLIPEIPVSHGHFNNLAPFSSGSYQINNRHVERKMSWEVRSARPRTGVPWDRTAKAPEGWQPGIGATRLGHRIVAPHQSLREPECIWISFWTPLEDADQ